MANVKKNGILAVVLLVHSGSDSIIRWVITMVVGGLEPVLLAMSGCRRPMDPLLLDLLVEAVGSWGVPPFPAFVTCRQPWAKGLEQAAVVGMWW